MAEQPDPVMAEIGEVVAVGQAGDHAMARERFAELWDTLGPAGDPLHRCALAHYAADVQDDPREELRWDLRALEAADEVTDERAQAYHASLAVAGFYPSLHLNLADVYRRLGEQAKAQRHLVRATDTVGTLADDGYGQLIRAGITRCAARLAEENAGYG